MFLDRLFKFQMMHLNCETILQYLPDEALLELAEATYGDRFYNKSTFSQTNFGC